ncbi:MAG TPA: hypothetical protein P5102_06550 [Candidatus Competibacteraceae bacterium]|nr:hypothetical protein [Candidatus Competibacteraceae bacterium]HSA45647.1 hypothetical protein [Candidatus Competibacteraceae bacterium]
MNKCSYCGKYSNTLGSLCDDCKSLLDEKQKKLQESIAKTKENEKKVQEAIRKENREKIIEIMKINKLMERINNGERVFLYETIFFLSDSRSQMRYVNISKGLGAMIDLMKGNVDTSITNTEHFDASQIMKMGIEGWHIVSTIPRQFSVSMPNIDGVAVLNGSNITFNGYYVILQKELSKDCYVSHDFLIDYFKRNMDKFFSDLDILKLNELFSI